jgi:hypothetical protein
LPTLLTVAGPLSGPCVVVVASSGLVVAASFDETDGSDDEHEVARGSQAGQCGQPSDVAAFAYDILRAIIHLKEALPSRRRLGRLNHVRIWLPSVSRRRR